MKFLTTGHTSGIGKSIYDHFGGKGLSRSTGFDISKDDIIPHLEGIDIFVNNAFSFEDPWAQTKLLHDSLIAAKIIVIGSNTTDQTKNQPHPYQSAKLALENSCNQLFYQGYDITLIKPGYVDTPMVENVNESKLASMDIVETLEWILFQSFKIKEITICPK